MCVCVCALYLRAAAEDITTGRSLRAAMSLLFCAVFYILVLRSDQGSRVG